MTSFVKLKLRLALGAVIFLAAFGLTAQACCPPVLLTIDVTDPSAVVITSTGAFSSINDNTTSTEDGVDLLNFFTSSVLVTDPIVSGGLTPAGATFAFNSWQTDDASGTQVDLNLWTSTATEIQSFSTCSSAFTGSWTIDLSAFGYNLPSVGDTGDIMVGYSGSRNGSGESIGLWEIVSAPVPEPSQYGIFLCLALGALMIAKRLPSFRRPAR